ncbi:MAG: hypothetical protein ACYDAG_18380 [Chloroflexota bacterium]
MGVGTTVAIVAAVIAGYGGLVALIVSQGNTIRTEVKAEFAKRDAKIDTLASRSDGKTNSLAERLDGRLAALQEDIYTVGRQVEHVEGRMDEISGIVRAALAPRAA